MKSDKLFQQLFKSAQSCLKNSYSPYSHVRVASAVKMSDGRIFNGCNIENASYGGTICAERVAITKALSEGSKKITAILVTTNQNEIWPPCGLCRQVIAEFSTPKTIVYSAAKNKKYTLSKFSDLLPGAFNKEHLR